MKELTIRDIQTQIITLPNRPPAMLASNCAAIYEVETRQVNQAVRRNPDRFPEHFCFRLSDNEVSALVSQNVIPSIHSFGGHLPWMFSRYGANQLSTVLKSKVAASRSIQIIEAFSALEEMAQSGAMEQVDPTMTVIPKDRYIELLEAENRTLKAPKPIRKTPTPLTNEIIVKIYDMLAQGRTGKEISEALNISGATVSFVRKLRPSIPLHVLSKEGNA